MKQIFYVDWAMCGGEGLPVDFDLEDFCEVLAGANLGNPGPRVPSRTQVMRQRFTRWCPL